MTDSETGLPEARRFCGDRGSNLVEYSLLMALIVVVCLGALTIFGRNATARMSCVSSVITNQVTTQSC